MNISLFVLIGALVYSATNLLKYFRAKDWNGVLTQLVVWGAGVVAVFLGSATDFADSHLINDIALGDMNWATKTLLGLMATSLFTFGHDVKKALDNRDSAQMPSLFSGEYPPVADPAHVTPGPAEPQFASGQHTVDTPVGPVNTK